MLLASWASLTSLGLTTRILRGPTGSVPRRPWQFATPDASREIRRRTRPRGMGARNVEVTTFRETDETPEIVGQLFARPKARRICALGGGKHGPSPREFDALRP